MRWRAATAALVFVVIASLALNAYQYSFPRSVTVTSAIVETSSQNAQGAFNYGASNVTIPIPSFRSQGLPSFIVGNYLFSATSEGPPLPNPRNGSTTYLSGVRVTFTATATQMIPTVSQKVNFTWAGTFCDGCLPGPINATLFNGAVQMSWFTSSSLSYLHITTKWPPVI